MSADLSTAALAKVEAPTKAQAKHLGVVPSTAPACYRTPSIFGHTPPPLEALRFLLAAAILCLVKAGGRGRLPPVIPG